MTLVTACPSCHQPIAEPPLERLMAEVRRQRFRRAREASQREGRPEAESDVALARWHGEGYDG